MAELLQGRGRIALAAALALTALAVLAGASDRAAAATHWSASGSTAPAGAVQTCAGDLRAKGARRAGYRIAVGESSRVGIELRRAVLERLIRRGRITLAVEAHNRDALGGSS